SPGQSGSTVVTIVPHENWSGSVTLTCTPDPNASETACGFASGSSTVPSLTVNVGGTNATATFVVTTTASHTLTGWLRGWDTNRTELAFGFLIFLGMPGLARKQRWLALMTTS